MRLATLRRDDGTTFAAKVDGDSAIDLGMSDICALLVQPDWRTRAATETGPPEELGRFGFAPVVPSPGKIWCVGLNYRQHILEMGRDLPEHPTLFAKFADALIGAHDHVLLAPESTRVDWEGELAVVIGTEVRRASAQQAATAIAGFTVLNDVTMRDWQYRSSMWLQGKTFEHTTPIGPVLVTPDELPGGVHPDLELSVTLNETVMQKASTGDLLFDPCALVQYVSTIVRLRPGDVIATGTPGGVGHARSPQVYLQDGNQLVTRIEGIGELVNQVREEEV